MCKKTESEPPIVRFKMQKIRIISGAAKMMSVFIVSFYAIYGYPYFKIHASVQIYLVTIIHQRSAGSNKLDYGRALFFMFHTAEIFYITYEIFIIVSLINSTST